MNLHRTWKLIEIIIFILDVENDGDHFSLWHTQWTITIKMLTFYDSYHLNLLTIPHLKKKSKVLILCDLKSFSFFKFTPLSSLWLTLKYLLRCSSSIWSNCQILSKCLKTSVLQPHLPSALRRTVYSKHVVTFAITVKVVFQVMNSRCKYMSAVHGRFQNSHSIRIPAGEQEEIICLVIVSKGTKHKEITLLPLLPPKKILM